MDRRVNTKVTSETVAGQRCTIGEGKQVDVLIDCHCDVSLRCVLE